MPHATTSADLTLHYVIDGPDAAPVVVLSNSIGTNVDLWAPIVPRLAEKFRVVRYDSRGHGGSTTPAGDYTMSQLAGDIAAILDDLAVERAHVVGLSVGGQTALTFALEHPERLDRLVVSNTGAKIGTEQSWADRAAKVRGEGLEAIVDAVTAGWLTPSHAAENPEQLATLKEWFLGNDPEGYAATCIALGHTDLNDRLGEISAPTLVIGTTGDVPTPPALTFAIADGIPGATRVEIPGAHLSVQEAPEAYAEAVLAHLS